METILNLIHGHEAQFLLVTYLIFFTLMIFGIVNAVYKIIKTEKARNKYIPTMKVNDEVEVSNSQGFNAKISSINDNETVDVITRVNIRNIYPKKNDK